MGHADGCCKASLCLPSTFQRLPSGVRSPGRPRGRVRQVTSLHAAEDVEVCDTVL